MMAKKLPSFGEWSALKLSGSPNTKMYNKTDTMNAVGIVKILTQLVDFFTCA
jgi:hypothetical protein